MDISTINAITVLTGAGISAESGIQTFRASDGLWEDHKIEDVASPEGYRKNPELVQRFYNARRHQLLHGDIHPNPAHITLAKLEQEFSGRFLLITQNIDNLHERAGSKKIIHMHGELLKMHCEKNGGVFPIETDLTTGDYCSCCGQPGNLRPHIVWFGEMPMGMNTIDKALSNCDLFIAIGTSGNVYPAAGFVQVANAYGANTVEINLEPSEVEANFTTHIYGKASVEVPNFVDELLFSR